MKFRKLLFAACFLIGARAAFDLWAFTRLSYVYSDSRPNGGMIFILSRGSEIGRFHWYRYGVSVAWFQAGIATGVGWSLHNRGWYLI